MQHTKLYNPYIQIKYLLRSNLKKREDKLAMLTIALDTQTDATKMSDLKHAQFIEGLCSLLGSFVGHLTT